MVRTSTADLGAKHILFSQEMVLHNSQTFLEGAAGNSAHTQLRLGGVRRNAAKGKCRHTLTRQGMVPNSLVQVAVPERHALHLRSAHPTREGKGKVHCKMRRRKKDWAKKHKG